MRGRERERERMREGRLHTYYRGITQVDSEMRDETGDAQLRNKQQTRKRSNNREALLLVSCFLFHKFPCSWLNYSLIFLARF